MTWPYHFLTLDESQLLARRQTLDRYGIYSQLSAIIPILVFLLYRVSCWIHYEHLSRRSRTKIDYTAIPMFQQTLSHERPPLKYTTVWWRKTVWWLEDEQWTGWGNRGHWAAAIIWTIWLLFLCVHRTGDDYKHLTRRFGIVSVAQFPLHYMMSMKSAYSPLAIMFRASHEQISPYHRFSGRIIYSLLLIHGGLYLNFFIQQKLLPGVLGNRAVVIGLLSLLLLSVMNATSLSVVRQWSYRIFFTLHVLIGIAILPVLLFHASHLRFYVIEALALVCVDLIGRKLFTTPGESIISPVPKTRLVKLVIPVPASKIERFRAAPGQHVYLSIPSESIPSENPSNIRNMICNPFTIAEVDDQAITLVLRIQNGPMTQALAALSKRANIKSVLRIEGPYGATRHFSNLATRFDRVLLVAGGVGATFILPIYQHLQGALMRENKSLGNVQLIWTMRSASEIAWAVPAEKQDAFGGDPNVKLFLSRNHSEDEISNGSTDSDVEMIELVKNEESEKQVPWLKGRPDLMSIVNDTFQHDEGEKVAVICCAPVGLKRDLKAHVGIWVAKGRDIWWHDEYFGW